jgi:hypothetical protein
MNRMRLIPKNRMRGMRLMEVAKITGKRSRQRMNDDDERLGIYGLC